MACQRNGMSQSISKIDSLVEYYSLINSAELAITRVDYYHASQYYKEAFQIHLMGKDLMNAFLCSYLLGNYEQTIEYGNRLCKYGFDFKKQFIQCGDTYFLNYIDRFDSCRKKLNYQIDSFMRDLFERDQITRKDSSLRKYQSEYDSINLKLIYNAFGTGLPSFDSVGFAFSNGIVYNERATIPWVLHNNRGDISYLDSSFMIKCIYEGTISPEVVMGLWMHQTRPPLSYPLADSLGLHIWNYPKWDSQKIKRIDALRSDYFLPNCEDWYVKYLFLQNVDQNELPAQFVILHPQFEVFANFEIFFGK